MNITPHFSLEEFLVSQTATRHGIDMTPPLDIENNIILLAESILEPLRVVLDSPIMINSGYRPEDLNSLIGGSKTSAHRYGCAADIRSNKVSPLELAGMIVELGLPYDQVIHEFGVWVHVGIRWDAEEPRLQELTAYRSAEQGTKYVNGLVPVTGLS